MQSELKAKALAYLDREPLLHINMTEPLRRGMAEVLYAGDDGVLLMVGGEMPLLSCADARTALRLTEDIEARWSIVVAQEHSVEPMKKRFGFNRVNACYNTAYMKKTPLPVSDVAEVRTLGEEYAESVHRIYHNGEVDMDYIRSRLAEGVMLGAFVDGRLAGFVGMHDDGSGGLLEVLPEYRRLHIGTLLESAQVNSILAEGHVPFGQFFDWNDASRRLQRSMGMEISESMVYWLFHGE